MPISELAWQPISGPPAGVNGRIPTSVPPTWKFVARDEVAAAAAGILLGEDHAGAIYNAARAKPYSGAELAAVFSQVMGKGGLAQMGLPTEIVETVISIQTDFATGAFDIVPGEVTKVSGPRPKAAERGACGRPPKAKI